MPLSPEHRAIVQRECQDFKVTFEGTPGMINNLKANFEKIFAEERSGWSDEMLTENIEILIQIRSLFTIGNYVQLLRSYSGATGYDRSTELFDSWQALPKYPQQLETNLLKMVEDKNKYQHETTFVDIYKERIKESLETLLGHWEKIQRTLGKSIFTSKT